MTMKSKLYEMMLLSAMLGSGVPVIDTKEESIEELNERIARAKERRLKTGGVKEFTIDGITVNALNYKSALRKVKNYLKSAK